MKKTISCFCLCASALAADSFFDNLPAFQPFAAQTVLGSSAYAGIQSETPAMSFVAPFSATLSEIDLALGWVRGTNAVDITVASDSGGLPGSVLLSGAISKLPTFGTIYAPEAFVPADTVTLTAGDRYWLIVAPGASDTWVAWNRNATDAIGIDAFSVGGAGFCLGDASQTCGNAALAAFDVIDAPALPEPPLGAMLCLTVLAVLNGRRLCR